MNITLCASAKESIKKHKLSMGQFIRAMTEVLRVAELSCPEQDRKIVPIKCTNGHWHRLKTGELRIILNIGKAEIEVKAILPRTDLTYVEVRQLWVVERNGARANK